MTTWKPTPPAWFVGEALGTFILVFFGCGSVAAAVLTGAQLSLFEVAAIWGLGIATAIYLTASLSGAHLNPAVTVAFAVWSGFPWHRVPRYITAQLLGAVAASAALFAAYHGVLGAYESSHHIVRGGPGSEATAMIFGEFYPNPGGQPLTELARSAVTMPTAFFVEALGTAILMIVILGSVDFRNTGRPRALTALTIGLTVTILISLLAPLTMAAFNPARDLGPRLFSAIAGWGRLPFLVNGSGWLVVYVLGPITGAVCGGGLYKGWLAPHYAAR
jgi:glycerol uptake facilitator protein